MSSSGFASPPNRLFNRELSWLAFNERVAQRAADRNLPLLERVKFIAIQSRNLDEFFQVRVGGLKTQLEAGIARLSPDGLSAAEQLRAIRAVVEQQSRARDELFEKELRPALAAAGIRITDWDDLSPRMRERIEGEFEDRVFPVLTPLTVDPVHPFPSISNLSLNLAVILQDPASELHRFARIKVPNLLPRFLRIPDSECFVPIEQMIAAHLEHLFPGREIASHHVFRVTLDAELSIDEREHEDLHAAIMSGLHRRLRLNDAVRLELSSATSDEVREILLSELDLGDEDVYRTDRLLDLGGLFTLCELDRPDLKIPPWAPQPPPRLRGPGHAPDVFEVLSAGDVLVHHPYESFRLSVEEFLTQAAEDPDVLAIKNTLYRTSGKENPITRALVRAARAGKEVVALIELKARFDEESNLEWARWLRLAGVHVVYGLVGLKTHAKIALVVRREGDEIRRYWHVGTGNYNPITADHYEDVGILSSGAEIGAELAQLFNHLTGWSQSSEYRNLLVAPHDLRDAVVAELERISRSGGGNVTLKVNGLSDPAVIDALYAASQRGCRIELLVRGICCLRPGVPGLSENIRVRSIIGRFLEHSRIFRFESDSEPPRYFIGSVDLMTHKLDKRVEVMVSVRDRACQRRLDEILAIDLADNRLAWELRSDGVWVMTHATSPSSSQDELQVRAMDRVLASTQEAATA